MIAALYIVSATYLQEPVVQDVVYASVRVDTIPVQQVLDALNLPDRDHLLDKYCLNMEVRGATTFVWDRALYDQKAADERVNLWKKLGSGNLKPGELVELEDTFGALSTAHEYLREQYGLTEDTISGVKAGLGLSKQVTLEDADGNLFTVTIMVNRPGDKPNLSTLDKKAKLNALKEEEPKAKSESSIRLQFAGFGGNPKLKFDQASKLFEFLSARMNEEYLAIEEGRASFDRLMSSGSSGGGLTDSEMESLEEKIKIKFQGSKSLSDFKIKGSQVEAVIGVKFLVTDSNGTHYEVPNIPIDRPKASPKPITP